MGSNESFAMSCNSTQKQLKPGESWGECGLNIKKAVNSKWL